jgi:hypothetical protein
MKLLANTILVVLLSLFAVTVSAQKINAVKPALFASYPTTISCKETELKEPFKALKGQNVIVSFAGTPVFSGVVVNNTTKSKNLQYLAIRLPGLDNAVMALSKRIDENNNTVYIGHIINTKNSDAYELKHSKDGSYQFVKMDLEKLLPTCSQK